LLVRFFSSQLAWQATNSGLQDRIAALGTGLIRLAGLKPGQSKVLLLLNDGIGKSYLYSSRYFGNSFLI